MSMETRGLIVEKPSLTQTQARLLREALDRREPVGSDGLWLWIPDLDGSHRLAPSLRRLQGLGLVESRGGRLDEEWGGWIGLTEAGEAEARRWLRALPRRWLV